MKMKLQKRIACVIFMLIGSVNVNYGQSNEIIEVPWGEEKTLTQGDRSIIVPHIVGQDMDGNIPNFFIRKKIKDNTTRNTEFELVSTIPASLKEIAYLNSQNIEVSVLRYDLKVSKSREERHVVLNLFPFLLENGQVVKVHKFNLIEGAEINDSPNLLKTFVANSALKEGSGSWYKISINQDGIYKLDRNFLEQCNVNVDNLNPQHIHIFGNGEGRIPELNSIPRTDDLAEVSIIIVDGGDGSFDANDYVLFYGEGPHKWTAVGTSSYDQDRNPYSDFSGYFINIDSSKPPKIVSSMPNGTGIVTNNVSTYSYHAVHELDANSLIKAGQRWYGELYDDDTQMQYNYLFNVSSIDNSVPVTFDVSIASNSTFGAGSSHTYTANGVQIGTSQMPSGAGAGNYRRQEMQMEYPNPSSSINLLVSMVKNSPDVLTYMDRILLNARRNLSMTNHQFTFSDLNSVGAGNVSEFSLTGIPSSGFVWNVTDRHNVSNVLGIQSGTNFQFVANTSNLEKWVASDGVSYLTPSRVGGVANQNLHGLSQADYLIVTNSSFLSQANRLANLHRDNGLIVHVVTDTQVFNEFSSGMKDASAIRMFAKMFYERGASDPSTRPKNLLLFGDGTFDPKNRVANNNNYILTYQVLNSEDHIAALVTDDYFGLLDDSESILSSDELDIGVGRLLISDVTMAKQQVDKIEHYMKNGSSLFSSAGNADCDDNGYSSTFGDWRTRYVQIADDEEGAYFLDFDVEPQYDSVKLNNPEMNCEKIYLDAYQQISTVGGERYPEATNAINRQIDKGCILMNYVGHGGEVGVAEERAISVPQIQGWSNINKLPLIVSATCEFTKYDDPDRVSAGEWASLNPDGAAIALMTTTRSVFFGVNTNTGKSFFKSVFERDENFQPLSFGEIIRRSKNGVNGSNNKRSFTLIGDPALQIAIPRMKIITDSVNGISPNLTVDTIMALSTVTIKGHVEDFNGNALNNFNGTVYPTIYDKPKNQQTLGNDTDSPLREFEVQTNKLYRGKATVTDGYFEFTFVVPKDINYSIDYGKLSYYAENGETDAIGSETNVKIGGIDPNGISDNQGPDIEMFLNTESFVNGGLTDENPKLIAKLFDQNGINTVGNGIGHDLVAIIDDNSSDPFVLNDYYVSDIDSYQSGEIRFDFLDLEPGAHTLTLKVWDVNNNSSESVIDFVVQESAELELDHVLNYPNPFTTSTQFFFEHNQVCTQLEVQLQIMTISGRLVKSINKYVTTEGFRSEGIEWDGRDDFGDQLAKGVYVYRLIVTSPDGVKAEKLEKLVILK